MQQPFCHEPSALRYDTEIGLHTSFVDLMLGEDCLDEMFGGPGLLQVEEVHFKFGGGDGIIDSPEVVEKLKAGDPCCPNQWFFPFHPGF